MAPKKVSFQRIFKFNEGTEIHQWTWSGVAWGGGQGVWGAGVGAAILGFSQYTSVKACMVEKGVMMEMLEAGNN